MLQERDECPQRIWSSTRHFYSINYVRGHGHGHKDPVMVCDTQPPHDASTYQIWESYLKEYKRYALDTIILKLRSEFRATVTQKWFATLRHPKISYNEGSTNPVFCRDL